MIVLMFTPQFWVELAVAQVCELFDNDLEARA